MFGLPNRGQAARCSFRTAQVAIAVVLGACNGGAATPSASSTGGSTGAPLGSSTSSAGGVSGSAGDADTTTASAEDMGTSDSGDTTSTGDSEASSSSSGELVVAEDWSLVVLPDTQYYSESYPEIFAAQTEFIRDNADELNIKYVLHEGDIVDNNNLPQWDVALKALSTLDDALIPYALCVGNHDLGPGGGAGTRDTEFVRVEYFGPGSAYAAQPSIGGFYAEAQGRTENSFHTFFANGDDWLVVSIEFGPRDEVVQWANDVVQAHPDHLVILLTHAYLNFDDARYDYATHGSSQAFTPYNYGVADEPGGVNDGQELWDGLVANASGFRFMLSGHVLGDGTGHLASTGVAGNVVHQILANYQSGVDGSINGGDGYLRIMRFLADGDTVEVTTYSPYRDALGQDAFKTEPDHQFIVSMTSET